ncbi:hypothetical protein EON63_10855 [archaeon]|nr:MAG: hypothetical protein EON63_10855 [archaeon]
MYVSMYEYLCVCACVCVCVVNLFRITFHVCPSMQPCCVLSVRPSDGCAMVFVREVYGLGRWLCLVGWMYGVFIMCLCLCVRVCIVVWVCTCVCNIQHTYPSTACMSEFKRMLESKHGGDEEDQGDEDYEDVFSPESMKGEYVGWCMEYGRCWWMV